MLGVAITSDPKGRLLRDGYTLEVSRVCTAGARNACSKLYGACARAARSMGYRRLVTYTLESEDGASLRASGWVKVHHGDRARDWLNERGLGRTAGQSEPVDRWEIRLSDRPPALIWPAEVAEPTAALFEVPAS